jgi:hypothetical protein
MKKCLVAILAVSDRVTYEHPTERSTGMRFVVVNGVLVIDKGSLVTGVLPGRSISMEQAQ